MDGMMNRNAPPVPAVPARPAAIPAMVGRRPFAKGGTASKRADGCAKKGKTKGKIV